MTENFYRTFKYAESKYGASTQTDRLRWAIQADWEGEDFTRSENLADMVIDMLIRRGRDFFIRLDGQNEASGFNAVRPGSLTITLDDPDRIYDPNNTDSPLYPNVEPGAPIRVLVRIMPDAAKIPLFTGEIIDIQSIDNGNTHSVTISAVDDLQKLSDINIRSGVEQDILISDAVDEALDLAGWPSAKRNIIASDITIPYWWEDRRAYSAIYDLTEAEGGYFFVDAEGRAVFYTQFYGTQSVLELSQSEILKQIRFSVPWETTRNRLQVFINPVVEQAQADLWKLSEIPEIGPGQRITYLATYSSGGQSVSALNVITPASTTDYLANANAAGTGANRTANIQVVFTNFGQTAKIDLTNNGSTSAFITLLKIRGNPLTKSPVTISEMAEGQNNRLFKVDSRWIQGTVRARALVNKLGLFMPSVKKFPTIQLESQPEKQFSAELFDIVDLDIPARGIDNKYAIGLIEHRWLSKTGQAVRTKIICEEPVNLVDAYLTPIAAEFFGTGNLDTIDFGNIPGVSNIPERTLACRVWIDEDATADAIFKVIGGPIADEGGTRLSYSSERERLYYYSNLFNVFPGIWDADYLPVYNQWITFVASHRPTTLTDVPELYINGAPVSVTEVATPAGTLNTEISRVTIGNIFTNTLAYDNPFFGKISDFCIYNRVFTSTDAANYHSGNVPQGGLLFRAPYAPKNSISNYIDQPLTGLAIFDGRSALTGTINGAPFGREIT